MRRWKKALTGGKVQRVAPSPEAEREIQLVAMGDVETGHFSENQRERAGVLVVVVFCQTPEKEHFMERDPNF